MIIGMGADHGGYELKEHIKSYLTEKGYEIKDYGIYDGEAADYPDVAFKTCEGLLSGECERALLFCGTGIGISIAANKVDGIRCAHCTDSYSSKMARQHNNANVIALGGRITGACIAEEIVDAYLGAEFLGGRHGVRVDKIMNYNQNANVPRI